MKDFANEDFKTFAIKVPYSLDDNLKDGLIDLIKSNLDKINEDNTIEWEDNLNPKNNKLNPLYIKIYSLKNYYMVSTLLNLISTIHVNLGMTYYEQQNQPQNQQNIRR
jgi:hypothetical protein